ncbi:MAG: glycosyl transferase, partial [Pedosphaera sp.]|nr:glycosyl transferase [Pedosphaera sp.]
ERLLAAGGFDETMVRNQDDELSFRLRKASGRVVQSSSLRVKYHVRDSFKKLFLQFAQYGYWKVRVVRKHPRQASTRHFIPALLVLALLITALAAPFAKIALWASGAILGGYFAVLLLASLMQLRGPQVKLWPGVVGALAMMHFGYGLGFLLGWGPRLAIFGRTSR